MGFIQVLLNIILQSLLCWRSEVAGIAVTSGLKTHVSIGKAPSALQTYKW